MDIIYAMLYNDCVVSSALWGSVFSFFSLKPQIHVGKEPNLDCFQHMYRRCDANIFGSVRLVVREKISSQTDGHGEYISVFFPMKKALINLHKKQLLFVGFT